VSALQRVGRECDFVFTSRSITSLEAAVQAGLGIMVLPMSRVPQTGLSAWEDAPLPELSPIYCGIYLRDGGGNRVVLEELADEIAAALRPPLEVKQGGVATVPEVVPAPALASGSGH
jgi:DNA-binding transcriptional LysR family regulator